MIIMASQRTEAMKLIVKAPNQLIEDQNIECDLTWTVLDLKEHLAVVYPSKPAVADQKLIYSGQLLSDSTILKDVLRKYEGQKAHSMHLVCMPPRGAPDTWRKSTIMSSVSQQIQPSTLLPGNSNAPSLPQNTTATTAETPATPTETRENTATPPPVVSNQRQQGWNWFLATQQQFLAASAQYPSMAAYPHAVSQMYDPVSLAQMQQVYSQYMTQYLCQLQQAGVSAEMLGSMHAQAQQNWNLHQNQSHGARVAPAANPVAPVVANPQNNVPAAPQMIGADDDDMRLGRQRDWLDWFYVLSRLLVLFSIVYFYSSLKRFILVAALGLVLYLYHLGYFRMQPAGAVEAENNNLPARDVAPEPRPDDEVQNAEAGGMEEPPVAPEETEGIRQRRQGVDPPEDIPAAEPVNLPAPPVETPSIIMLTWTFVSSFFASLIPDRPNVV